MIYDKGDHITLRPELPSRSFLCGKQTSLHQKFKPSKFYYMGPMFRYERPQAGRLRQFHQIGVKCFGSSNPATDVETIAMAAHFLKEIGIKDVKLHLNTLEILRAVRPTVGPQIDYSTPLKETFCLRIANVV